MCYETVSAPRDVDPFALAFRASATPKLRRLCGDHGTRVARGRETIATAAGAVMRIAYDLGAGRLPDHLRAGLEDWVEVQLVAAVARARVAEAIRRGDIL